MTEPITASEIRLRRRGEQMPVSVRRLCNTPTSAIVVDAVFRCCGGYAEDATFRHGGQRETETTQSESPKYFGYSHLPPVNSPSLPSPRSFRVFILFFR